MSRGIRVGMSEKILQDLLAENERLRNELERRLTWNQFTTTFILIYSNLPLRAEGRLKTFLGSLNLWRDRDDIKPQFNHTRIKTTLRYGQIYRIYKRIYEVLAEEAYTVTNKAY